MFSGSPGRSGSASSSSSRSRPLLRDVLTGAFPVVSYWRRTIIESDTRLPALAEDASTYRFATPPDAGEVRLQAQVVLRRLFYEIAQQKGWDVPDIVVAEAAAPAPTGTR